MPARGLPWPRPDAMAEPRGRPHPFLRTPPIPALMKRLRRLGERWLRRVLHVYFRFARGMTLGVRALVIDAEGRIFLVRHTYVAGWQFPGGGVEPGETIGEALARELGEEGHIEILEPPSLRGLYFNARASRRDHVAFFVLRSFRQASAPLPNSEIAASGFFALDALPEDTTPATRARIAEEMSGTLRSDRW
jgi:ADP-ribose pyrophosphatase YjhB (NUDIX family)